MTRLKPLGGHGPRNPSAVVGRGPLEAGRSPARCGLPAPAAVRRLGPGSDQAPRGEWVTSPQGQRRLRRRPPFDQPARRDDGRGPDVWTRLLEQPRDRGRALGCAAPGGWADRNIRSRGDDASPTGHPRSPPRTGGRGHGDRARRHPGGHRAGPTHGVGAGAPLSAPGPPVRPGLAANPALREQPSSRLPLARAGARGRDRQPALPPVRPYSSAAIGSATTPTWRPDS